MRKVIIPAFLLALAASGACAQSWPPTTTTILVGLGPGAGLDLLARVIAQTLAERNGTNFIVENRAGGGGNVSIAALANARPDGATIAFSTFTPLVVNPWMVKTSYDPLTDVAPVAPVAETPSVIMAGKKLGVRSMKEFLALIKGNPDKFSYATAGLGTVSHITMESAASAVGTKMVQVPYRGAPEQIQALLAGDVDSATIQLGFIAEMIAAGQAIPLALTAEKRWPSFPDIPTAVEAGLPDMPTTRWIGVFAPKGTSPEIIKKLNGQINDALLRPDVRERMARLYYEPVGGSPGDLADKVKSDYKLWHSVLGNLRLLLSQQTP